MAVNEKYTSLMSTLFPGSMATDPTPYTFSGAMWKAFADLFYNTTSAVNGGKAKYMFFCMFLNGYAVIGPVRPRTIYGRLTVVRGLSAETPRPAIHFYARDSIRWSKTPRCL